MKYVECEHCGQTIAVSVYKAHLRRHINHPETFKPAPYALTHEGLDCQYCGKTCKSRNSLCNHERLCKENPSRQITGHNGFDGYNKAVASGQIQVWNKGLDKETDERISRMADALSKSTKGKQVSESTRSKISISIKQAYKDGRLGNRLHRLKHDRNCYGTYKGYECDSSWELAYVIYNIDHNIKFERNHDFFIYQFNGEDKKYFPDFKIDDTYVEIKGMVTERDKAKFAHFPEDKKLIVIDDKSIDLYLDYCKEMYGDFTIMYDRNYPSFLDNKDAEVV